MATGRKGGKVQSKIQALLYGEQFTGKSTLALQLMYLKRPDGKPFRVLYLDAENGSVDDYLEDLEDDGIDLDNLYIVYTQSLKEVNEYVRKATNKEPFYVLDEDGEESIDEIVLDADGEQFIPDAIVVDGTTVLNMATKQGFIEFSKKRATVKANKDNLVGDERFVKVEGASIELKDYNTLNFKGQDLILTLTGSGLHYVVTARQTDEKQTVKNKEGKDVTVCTGRKIPEGFKGMGYNAKTEMRLFVEDGIVKAHVIKDRTHTYKKDDIIEDPSLLAFQAVIDKTKNNKDVIVQNRLHDAVKNELKSTEKEVLGEEVDNKPQKQENENDLRDQLKNIVKGLSPVKKQKLNGLLSNNGLPTPASKIVETEQIEKAIKLAQTL